MIKNRICILGTGAWATALGVFLSIKNIVFMWGINQKEINDINSGYNKYYFGEKKLYSSLSASNDLNYAIGNSKYIILAVPSSSLKEVLEKLKKTINKNSKFILINAIKGFDPDTNDVLSKTIKSILKGYKIKLVTICGPSFALEVFEKNSTILNAASKSTKAIELVSDLFNSSFFKIIPVNDEKGLQIYSALKNLLAIGIGIASSQTKSDNTISALLTIAINEMSLIATSMGAKQKTINTFCGVGDLFLTCTSNKSRNYSFGKKIFEVGLQQAIKENKNTIEGYKIYPIIKKIIKLKQLNLPLLKTIIDILDNKIKPENLVNEVWSLTKSDLWNKTNLSKKCKSICIIKKFLKLA